MDLLNIFVRSPGEMIYFILVITASLSGFLIVFGQRDRWRRELRSRRYLTVFAVISLAWIALAAAALVMQLVSLDARLILPPLERAITALSLVLLTWLYVAADHDQWLQLPRISVLVGVLAIVVGFALTAFDWLPQAASVEFNATIANAIWIFVPFLVTLFGIALCLLYFGLIVDAPLKIVFFELLAAGYGVTLLQVAQGTLTGDYIGLVRLAFAPAMGISVVLVYRVITADFTLPIAEPAGPPPSINDFGRPPQNAVGVSGGPTLIEAPARNPVERESVQLLRALGRILENATPSSMAAQVVNTVLETVRADVGALLRVQDANYADFVTVYDRIMKKVNAGMSLNLDSQPTLINSIERRAQRPLYPDRNQTELEDLHSRLEISEIGPAYFQPLFHDDELVGVLLVANPYTKREMTVSEEDLVKGIAVIAAGLLALGFQAQDATLMAEERAIQALVQGVNPAQIEKDRVLAARYEMQQSLQLAREQIAELGKQVVSLKLELDRERSRVAGALSESEEGLSVSQQMLAIDGEQQRLREERDQLMQRLQEAQAAIVSSSGDDDGTVLQELVNTLQHERDQLASERDRLQTQLQDLRLNDGLVVPEEFNALLERMSDEKARLEVERDTLKARLDEIQQRMDVAGIDAAPAKLAQMIGRLHEDRAILQAKYDSLVEELNRIQMVPDLQQELEGRVQSLSVQLKHMAEDREALVRQRDSFRKQRDEMNAKLESVKGHRARLMAQVANLELELKEGYEEQSKLRLDVQKLADERSDVFHQMAQLMATKDALTIERDQFQSQLQGKALPAVADGEHQSVASLQKMVNDLSTSRNKLSRAVHQLKRNLADMQNQLNAANVRAKATAPDLTPEVADMLVGLVQELRTPLTSMVGYLDLLLAESAGILGDMQRKFLQRIASNVVRLNSMIADLIQVARFDTGLFKLEYTPVDVVGVLEDVVTSATPQLREKGLMVTLNIEESIPEVIADREAVTQIIGQMLTNAYLVSPQDAEISIAIGMRKVILSRDVPKPKPVECVHFTVEDRGGGVLPEDEARVFTRRYQADNPLIPGLGDTGVGLSIAKTLAEAHNGRLWLESHQGVGSTLHAVLPLNNETRS